MTSHQSQLSSSLLWSRGRLLLAVSEERRWTRMCTHTHTTQRNSYPESCSLTCQVFAGLNPSRAFLRHYLVHRGLDRPGETSAMTHRHTRAASLPTAVFFTEGPRQNKKKAQTTIIYEVPYPACQTARLTYHLHEQHKAKSSFWSLLSRLCPLCTYMAWTSGGRQVFKDV